MSHETDEDHDQSTCPQCLAMVAQCQMMAGLSGVLEKMLEDGTFARMGREYGERRERACLEAVEAIVRKPRKRP